VVPNVRCYLLVLDFTQARKRAGWKRKFLVANKRKQPLDKPVVLRQLDAI